MQIKFGTDGWRAIIAEDYTYENVRRVAEGTVAYMRINGMKKAVIGYDCRFEGEAFAHLVAGVFVTGGIQVILNESGFVSTPMVSFAVPALNADLGVVITASHNPPAYNGYKLKSNSGGPSIPSEIDAIEQLIPSETSMPVTTIEEMKNNLQLEFVDLEKLYLNKVRESFDIEAIHESGLSIAYDAMYGAGQNAIRKLFPKAELLHCEFNPSFHGQAPEPIDRNLQELANLIRKNPGKYDVGLANDGDADRIGMYDENGDFVDSHHLLLLALDYLHTYKKIKGTVITTFSVTDKVRLLAEKYGLEVEVTKIGFKYIAERMQEVDIIVAGEESGGIAVAGHIPERDGIWIGLVIFEYMARTGKSLTQLIEDIYKKVGSFTCDRDDLHITERRKKTILHLLNSESIQSFGSYHVVREENMDGYKYILENGDWIMIRPSGTEPVLRVYAQAENKVNVKQLLNAAHDKLNSIQ